jgi:crotonobetainyl-CoA:carnitine CoA-transferase CaiB-like acyl-CoA transferase
MTGPLDGVRVVDVTSTLLGPYCTQLLAAMGAEVIKIESAAGDIARAMRDDSDQRAFILNRGKRSVVLDLKQQQAKAALAAIVRRSDVFVHNLRASAAARLGIDYESVERWNPRIVYCAATGYGRDGSRADEPAYDDIIQAVSGLASLQRDDAGAPRFMNTVLADKVSGLAALHGVLAALYHRERSGVGQMVEVSMFETVAAFLMVEHMQGMAVEPPAGPARNTRVTSPDRRPYLTADGAYVAVLPYTDAQWQRLCEVIERPDLADHHQLRSARFRLHRVDLVYAAIAPYCLAKPSTDVISELRAADVPCAPVNSFEDLFDDPHLREVGFFSFDEMPDGRRVRHVRLVPQFSATPTTPPGPGAGLGEDSVDVLTEVGVTPATIEAMLASGATIDGRTRRG